MTGRIVFLLEEPSMKTFLEAWLPRAFPGWQEQQHFLCVAHQGKTDLDKSIPRKLRAWRVPGDRFVILRDNDNGDCVDIKARIQHQCAQAGRPDSLIRLVCQELESWYIGDLAALAAAYADPNIDTPARRQRLTNPDTWRKPSREVVRMVPAFQKRLGARRIAEHLVVDGNRSHSFQIFHRGLQAIATEMNLHPKAT